MTKRVTSRSTKKEALNGKTFPKRAGRPGLQESEGPEADNALLVVGIGASAGELTMVQSPEEADYGAMPHSAVASGHVDQVLPVAEMARALQAYRLREERGHLLKDLLLTVTPFFRDPEAFAVLEKEVIPGLFERKGPGEAVRAWVCGCATGEEAYSIAMLLCEEAERLSCPSPPLVFASDISDSALNVAREGFYPETIASDVSAERLHRFFNPVQGGFRIKPAIRERIVFAPHNLLQDPPFSRLDLVTCRNMLTYFEPNVQGRIFELFHFALQPDGYLLLGPSESIDTAELFRTEDTIQSLYRRQAGLPRIWPYLAAPASVVDGEPTARPETAHARPLLDVAALHRTLITPYAPPSVIVSADYKVVHTLGGGEAYLTSAPGEPTQDMLKIVREELRLELRAALYQAFRKTERTRSRAISVCVEDKLVQVELIVEPITAPGFAGDHVHVLFREVEPVLPRPTAAVRAEQKPPHLPEAGGPSSLLEAEAVIRHLEDELDRAKERLHTLTEEYEASNEQMTASNEEILLINEELRSTAEELETSKEELQSVNEELLALNEELKIKIEEINGIASDLKNLMNATEIGTIFLDLQLHIKRYTPRVEDLFHITGADVGRPLAHLTHKLGNAALLDDAAQVLRELGVIERELQHTENQQWFLVRLRPYYTVTGSIEGVVIAFINITERKKHEEQLETLVETLEVIIAARADQVRQLASELIVSEQAERQRISQILHDDLQQQLYALQMRMTALSRTLSQTHAERLAQANTLIAGTIVLTQTLTVDLSPPVLKGDDFTVALDWLGIQMEDMHGLHVAIEAPGPVRLPVDLRTLLYQLVRELLFNVVKHAGIDRACVKLLLGEDRLILVVADEGAGFDRAAEQERGPAKPGGFGLHSVRQRLDCFGGRLDIAAAPGQGTRVTLFVPLDKNPSTIPPGDDEEKPGHDR